MTTSIQWTEETWNPVTGCTKISPGCKRCYAERIWKKVYGYRSFNDIRFHADRLTKPLSWRTPKMVFVNSMSDLFHESVDRQVVAQVFAVMGWAWWHTFQVLTKRSKLMRELLNDPEFWQSVATHMEDMRGGALANQPRELFGGRSSSQGLLEEIRASRVKALQNVWLCVSVENDEYAYKRIPDLLATPAAVRGVSAEPLLDRLDIRPFLKEPNCEMCPTCDFRTNLIEEPCPNDGAELVRDRRVDWVIVGGESGTRQESRKFDLRWAYDIVAQCRAAKVPVFVKQLGRNPFYSGGNGQAALVNISGIKDSHGGRIDEWPEDLRIREFPALKPEEVR